MENKENQNTVNQRNITPSNSSANCKNGEIKSVRKRFRRIAILIGINQYKNGISPLDTPIKDAESLAETLIEYDYEVFKIDSQELPFEKNVFQNLNRDQLLQLFDHLKQEFSKDTKKNVNTRMIFYFAGHGTRAPEINKSTKNPGYIVPSDAVRDDESSYISMSDLKDCFDQIQCNHKLLILDCCYAGMLRWTDGAYKKKALTSNFEMYKQRHNKYLSRGAYQVLTSASKSQEALDSTGRVGDDVAHSPFAEALLEGLRDKKADFPTTKDGRVDGIITISELSAYIIDRVSEEANAANEHSQTPQLFELKGHGNGQYVFETDKFNFAELNSLEPKNPYKGRDFYTEADDNEIGCDEETVVKICTYLNDVLQECIDTIEVPIVVKEICYDDIDSIVGCEEERAVKKCTFENDELISCESLIDPTPIATETPTPSATSPTPTPGTATAEATLTTIPPTLTPGMATAEATLTTTPPTPTRGTATAEPTLTTTPPTPTRSTATAEATLTTTPPMPTSTWTPIPTHTATPMPTNTATPMPTHTATPMPTNTATPPPEADP